MILFSTLYSCEHFINIKIKFPKVNRGTLIKMLLTVLNIKETNETLLNINGNNGEKSLLTANSQKY